MPGSRPPPLSASDNKKLLKAAKACSNDKYGDGDQSLIPNDTIRRHITANANSYQEAAGKILKAAEKLLFLAYMSALHNQNDFIFLQDSPETRFHYACFRGHITRVRSMLSDAQQKLKNGKTNALLHVLEKRRSNLRLSPLHFCILGSRRLSPEMGHMTGFDDDLLQFEDVIHELCLAGARVDSRDIMGHTPLALLITTGRADKRHHTSIIDALFKYGADPNTKLRCGVPLLTGPVGAEEPTMFRKLLEAGADLSAEPLHLPIVRDSPPMMKAMMEAYKDHWEKRKVCSECGNSGSCCSRDDSMDYQSAGQGLEPEVFEIHLETMTWRELPMNVAIMKGCMINHVTRALPRRIMESKGNKVGDKFVVKLWSILQRAGLQDLKMVAQFTGCVKVERKDGDFLLLGKELNMKEPHERLRQYIEENGEGFGMVYVWATWREEGLLELDLSKALPPPSPCW